MPWDCKDEKMTRECFVKEVLAKTQSKSKLCKKYGISRVTGDKWIKRYLNGESLENMSKKPHTVSNKINENIEKELIEYRKNYPAIGATKIHRMLLDEGRENIPSPRTINNVFQRNNLIQKQDSIKSKPFVRFEKEFANEMWQADFKGHFSMLNEQRCHIINILDDKTRFNICCEPLASETFKELQPVMIKLFKEYGLPHTFLCDNGNPWGTSQSTGFTKFEVWLMDLNILTLHGRIRHPQTQGKEERFNGNLTRELLNQTDFYDFEDAKYKLNQYRDFYNNKRPHYALDLNTPASIYTKSNLIYPNKIEAFEYPSECQIRKVKSSGYITIKGNGYFLSEAFADKEIALRESSKNGLINVYYRNFIISKIDINKRVFTMKKSYLIQNDPRIKVAEN